MLAYTLIVVFIAIISVLMVIVVLLQRGQAPGMTGGIGGGLAGGGGANNMMGARRTADFLSKTTAVLAFLFLSLSVLANFFIDQGTQQSTIQQRGADMPMNVAPPVQDDPGALPIPEGAGDTPGEGGQETAPPVDIEPDPDDN